MLKITKGVFLFTAFLVSVGLSAWAITSVGPIVAKKSVKVVPALLRIPRGIPTYLPGKPEPTSDSQYREFINTQMRVVSSTDMLRAATRDGRLFARNLSAALIRENLRVEHIPDSEMITVLYESEEPELSIAVTNAVVESYLDEFASRERRDKDDRLYRINRLLPEYRSGMKSKRSLLASLRAQSQELDPPTIEALEKAYQGHWTTLERLYLRRAELARRAKTADTTRERETTEAEIDDARTRLRETRNRLSKPLVDRINITREEEALRLKSLTVRKLAEEAERLEFEPGNRSRVELVHSAALE